MLCLITGSRAIVLLFVRLTNCGRYAFVMSLSSHFSIQIQNNCVIMNVDTNQHNAFSVGPPAVSVEDVYGCVLSEW